MEEEGYNQCHIIHNSYWHAVRVRGRGKRHEKNLVRKYQFMSTTCQENYVTMVINYGEWIKQLQRNKSLQAEYNLHCMHQAANKKKNNNTIILNNYTLKVQDMFAILHNMLSCQWLTKSANLITQYSLLSMTNRICTALTCDYYMILNELIL